MPVILEPADWSAWLGEAPGDPASLLHPSAGTLRTWPADRRVNSPKNKGPDLLKPPAIGRPSFSPDLQLRARRTSLTQWAQINLELPPEAQNVAAARAGRLASIRSSSSGIVRIASGCNRIRETRGE
jgi:hypothetical protein